MITPSMVYWITRFDVIHDLSRLLTGVFGFDAGVVLFALVCMRFTIDNTNKQEVLAYNKLKKLFLFLCPIPVFFGIVLVFLPTTKESAAIIVLPKIVNNENVQNISTKMLKLADNWIDELSPKKVNSSKR